MGDSAFVFLFYVLLISTIFSEIKTVYHICISCSLSFGFAVAVVADVVEDHRECSLEQQPGGKEKGPKRELGTDSERNLEKREHNKQSPAPKNMWTVLGTF